MKQQAGRLQASGLLGVMGLVCILRRGQAVLAQGAEGGHGVGGGVLGGEGGGEDGVHKADELHVLAHGQLGTAAKFLFLLVGKVLAVGYVGAEGEGTVAHLGLGAPGLGVVQEVRFLAAELVIDIDVPGHQEGRGEEGEVALGGLFQTARADAPGFLAGDDGLPIGEQGGGEPIPADLHPGHLEGHRQVLRAGALVELFHLVFELAGGGGVPRAGAVRGGEAGIRALHVVVGLGLAGILGDDHVGPGEGLRVGGPRGGDAGHRVPHSFDPRLLKGFLGVGKDLVGGVGQVARAGGQRFLHLALAAPAVPGVPGVVHGHLGLTDHLLVLSLGEAGLVAGGEVGVAGGDILPLVLVELVHHPVVVQQVQRGVVGRLHRLGLLGIVGRELGAEDLLVHVGAGLAAVQVALVHRGEAVHPGVELRLSGQRSGVKVGGQYGDAGEHGGDEGQGRRGAGGQVGGGGDVVQLGEQNVQKVGGRFLGHNDSPLSMDDGGQTAAGRLTAARLMVAEEYPSVRPGPKLVAVGVDGEGQGDVVRGQGHSRAVGEGHNGGNADGAGLACQRKDGVQAQVLLRRQQGASLPGDGPLSVVEHLELAAHIPPCAQGEFLQLFGGAKRDLGRFHGAEGLQLLLQRFGVLGLSPVWDAVGVGILTAPAGVGAGFLVEGRVHQLHGARVVQSVVVV